MTAAWHRLVASTPTRTFKPCRTTCQSRWTRSRVMCETFRPESLFGEGMKLDARPYDKLFHLNNAKALLQSDDLQSLRYASLEMRYFLEAHVYERLLQGVGTLPRSVIDKWEPNKAMKLLAMFDQYSDMDLRITISENDGSNPLTIDYPNIDNKTLSQQYNALGSYLHLPQPRKAADYKVKKSKLDAIYTSLERLTTGNLIIYSIPYETFNCEACDQPILYTNHYIHN